MKKLIGMLILLVILSAPAINADRGSISFKPNVQIFEPTQRAMIAWNGKEEILLLSTDLKASDSTQVLEVIPLPSEPVVKKGDVEILKKATELINKKLLEQSARDSYKGKALSTGREKPPVGEVTFHEKIGSHDISVTHVLDGNGFIEWVEKYLRSAGIENPMIPEAMKTVVDEYIREGFLWFVFDVISLDQVLKTNEAIQYQFKTDFLFYPLKITRTGKGYTSIDLLVLTPKLLNINTRQVRLLHEPISISSKELRSLSEDMDNLLGHRKNMKLRIWNIGGILSEFDKDLIVK